MGYFTATSTLPGAGSTSDSGTSGKAVARFVVNAGRQIESLTVACSVLKRRVHAEEGHVLIH